MAVIQETGKAEAPAATAAGEEGGWLETLVREVKEGRLALPSLPDIALRVRKAVQDPKRSASDVARMVQMDPALAARLVQVVNSPLYRGARPIDNCHTAITRLGLKATRNLVVSFTLRNLFQPETRWIADRLKHTWRHSCRVAAIASVLSRVTPGIDPDRALLAGLVHDIGELPVLVHLEQGAIDLPRAETEALLARLRGALGTFVLKAWKFEPDLAEVPKQVENWKRSVPGAADYVDVVQVAHVHACFGDASGKAPPLPELAAFAKLPLSKLGPDASVELLAQSAQEINEVIRILQ
ncbi:HDOD domain-containing protein [Thiohalobacter sp.]|uniref:HDOD domain-containing protein n=1 Tax=Thiohalobacter sp. TaxID=2025948 RepID=UPI0026030488|nr:HDOD domain-containing protein [Thiohalobacter sp.]